jgi:hypothetical protein
MCAHIRLFWWRQKNFAKAVMERRAVGSLEIRLSAVCRDGRGQLQGARDDCMEQLASDRV